MTSILTNSARCLVYVRVRPIIYEMSFLYESPRQHLAASYVRFPKFCFWTFSDAMQGLWMAVLHLAPSVRHLQVDGAIKEPGDWLIA